MTTTSGEAGELIPAPLNEHNPDVLHIMREEAKRQLVDWWEKEIFEILTGVKASQS